MENQKIDHTDESESDYDTESEAESESETQVIDSDEWFHDLLSYVKKKIKHLVFLYTTLCR